MEFGISAQLATEIAEKHLARMNPDMWDGLGDAPSSFDARICTYEVGSDWQELDVSFYFDEDEQLWCHYCELREKARGELLQPISGYGVDSVRNLVDSIQDACDSVCNLDDLETDGNLKEFRIPVVWQMMGYQVVKAESLDTALKTVAAMPLPENGEYLEDSFEIDMEGLEDFVPGGDNASLKAMIDSAMDGFYESDMDLDSHSIDNVAEH